MRRHLFLAVAALCLIVSCKESSSFSGSSAAPQKPAPAKPSGPDSAKGETATAKNPLPNTLQTKPAPHPQGPSNAPVPPTPSAPFQPPVPAPQGSTPSPAPPSNDSAGDHIKTGSCDECFLIAQKAAAGKGFTASRDACADYGETEATAPGKCDVHYYAPGNPESEVYLLCPCHCGCPSGG